MAKMTNCENNPLQSVIKSVTNQRKSKQEFPPYAET